MHCFRNYRDTRTPSWQVCCARRGGPRTPSTSADANLHCAFVENALASSSQQNIIELVTGPAPPQSHSAWASRPRASTSPSPSTSHPTPTPSRWPFPPLATLRRQRPSCSLTLVIQTWLRVISVKFKRMFERTAMPVLAGMVFNN